MSSAASAIDAPPLCLNRSPTCRAASRPRLPGAVAGPGGMRVGVAFAEFPASFAAVAASEGELRPLPAHGGESKLDDGGFVDLGDAVGRDALVEEEAAQRVVGLARAVGAEVLGELVGELGMLGAARGLHLLLGPLLGRRHLGLAAALGLGEQRLLFLALLHQALDAFRILLGQRLPVDARPLVGNGLAEGGTVLAPTTSPPARPLALAALATFTASWRACAASCDFFSA